MKSSFSYSQKKIEIFEIHIFQIPCLSFRSCNKWNTAKNSAVLLPDIVFFILASLFETVIFFFNLREALMVCYREFVVPALWLVSIPCFCWLTMAFVKVFFLNPSGLLNGVFKSYGDLR